MILITVFILALLTTLFLFIKEKKRSNDLRHNLRSLEISRDASLEYIEALWESQKGLIMDEKLTSLSYLISRISHELNTPLGVSLTSLSYINDSVLSAQDESLSKDIMPMLELALNSLDKSINLVKDFSEISGEKNYDSPKELSIKEFINYACCDTKYNNTKFIIDTEFIINIAQYNLAIIIKKIMDNAYDFANNEDKATEVTITVENDNKDLIIYIKDNGIGIPEKNIKNIFDPLYTTKRGSSHHGLGLAIAYNILINKYNGKIECLSTEGVGTTMIVTIPGVVSNKAIYTTS